MDDDGQMNEQMDGWWMETWMDEQMDGQTARWMGGGEKGECSDVQMDG